MHFFKFKSSLILCLLLTTLSPLTWAKSIPVETILKKVDSYRAPSGSFSFSVEVKEFDNKSAVRETVYRVFSKGSRFARIETTAPERLKGRKLLMVDNDLWLYLPTVNRPTRVSFQQKLTGEVSNGDIARTNFSGDYDARIIAPPSPSPKKSKDKKSQKRTIAASDPSSLHLVLRAKHKDVTYRKVHLWVDAKTFYPKKAKFFALSGKLLKTSEFSPPEKVFNRPTVTRSVIHDALNTNQRSHLRYFDYKREKLNDSFFRKQALVD